MLTINNPDDAQKRQNVKPLTVEEEKDVIAYLSFFLEESNTPLSYYDKIQRLIHNYENYRHFFEVVGGWDGLSKLQEDNDKFTDFINTLRFHNVINEDANQILKNNDTSK